MVIVGPDIDKSFFHIITFLIKCGGILSRHINFLFNDYAPSTP
jgi:hypothetical protein